MNTNITTDRTAIEGVLRRHGYGSYTPHADRAARVLPGGRVDAEHIRRAAWDAGVRQSIPFTLAQNIAAAINEARDGEAESGEQASEGFDRERAAAVLRAYAQRAGADMDEVEDVLIEAGLVDRPMPAASGDESSDGVLAALRAQVERLTEFARRHGFRG